MGRTQPQGGVQRVRGAHLEFLLRRRGRQAADEYPARVFALIDPLSPLGGRLILGERHLGLNLRASRLERASLVFWGWVAAAWGGAPSRHGEAGRGPAGDHHPVPAWLLLQS